MNTYELTYIISPEITGEEAENKAKEFEGLIQSKEGVILRQDKPIAKTLSYPIKKQGSGFIGVLEFQLEPEKLKEINENMAKNEKIIRHMIVIKNPAKAQKPRRTKKAASIFGIEFPMKKEMEQPIPASEKTEPEKTEKKIELKDIEQKLEEILGE